MDHCEGKGTLEASLEAHSSQNGQMFTGRTKGKFKDTYSIYVGEKKEYLYCASGVGAGEIREDERQQQQLRVRMRVLDERWEQES